MSEPVDVDDVVAVVFLEAWRHRERMRFVDGSILPWLLVTATNTSRNLERGKRRYRDVISRLPKPEARFFDPSESGDAVRAMRTLSITDQQVLTLCVLLNLSEKDAATLLAIPPGTVKSRLHHAKARLAGELNGDATNQIVVKGT